MHGLELEIGGGMCGLDEIVMVELSVEYIDDGHYPSLESENESLFDVLEELA